MAGDRQASPTIGPMRPCRYLQHSPRSQRRVQRQVCVLSISFDCNQQVGGGGPTVPQLEPNRPLAEADRCTKHSFRLATSRRQFLGVTLSSTSNPESIATEQATSVTTVRYFPTSKVLATHSVLPTNRALPHGRAYFVVPSAGRMCCGMSSSEKRR